MIDKLTIELCIPSKKGEKTDITICDNYYQKYFQTILDEIISQYSINNSFVINKLNIDLGKLPAEEIPIHLKYALEEAFSKYISDKPLGNKNNIISNIEEKEWQSNIFLNYIKSGYIDLLNNTAKDSFDSFIKDSIEEHLSDSTMFDKLLSYIIKDKRAFYRLTEDVDLKQLVNILKKILETNGYNPNDIIHLLHKEEKVFLEKTMDSSNLYTNEDYVPTTNQTNNVSDQDLTEDTIKETVFSKKKRNRIDKDSLSFIIERFLFKELKSSFDDFNTKIKKYIQKIINNKALPSDNYHNLEGHVKNMMAHRFQEEKEKFLTSVTNEANTLEDIGRIHIDDAGLILLNPFFHHFFSRLGYLNKLSEFKSLKHRIRAVHLLRSVAFGFEEKPIEHSLILSKVICGFSPSFPIDGSYRITKKEKCEVEDLLKTITEYWIPLNGTSIEGLQQSFLQRYGTIEKDDSSWIIRVEGKSLDILMEDLPWGFMTFTAPWTDAMIYVEWQKEL